MEINRVYLIEDNFFEGLQYKVFISHVRPNGEAIAHHLDDKAKVTILLASTRFEERDAPVPSWGQEAIEEQKAAHEALAK